MGWYCVHIELTSYMKVENATFLSMLRDERHEKGSPDNCKVYAYRRVKDYSYYYYFSPPASEIYSDFLKLWDGYECVPPTNLEGLEIIGEYK